MGTRLIERLATVAAVCQDYRPYAISPDGRTLAFQWYRDGDWQIFTLDLEGGAPRRVGDIDDPCWSPTFSPDGRYLYFSRDDRGSERFDFYRCELASGRLEDLLPDTPEFSPLQDFDVSPDGTRIAMTASQLAGYSIARHAGGGDAARRRHRPPARVPVHRDRRRAGRRTARASPSPAARAARTRPCTSSTRRPAKLTWSAATTLLRRAPGVVARRAHARVQRRPGRPPGHRPVRRRVRGRDLGLGRAAGRASPGLGAGRRRPRLPRRLRRRDRPVPHRPAQRRRERAQRRRRQPLRAELRRPTARRCICVFSGPGRARRPLPRRARRRRRDAARRVAARRSSPTTTSAAASRSTSAASTTSPKCPAFSSSPKSPTAPPS